LAEQITNALNRTKAIAEYMRGGVDQIVAPDDFLKIFLKLDDSEITTIMDSFTGIIRDEENEAGKPFDPSGNNSGEQSKKSEDKT
jgi:hypothetical protein